MQHLGPLASLRGLLLDFGGLISDVIFMEVFETLEVCKAPVFYFIINGFTSEGLKFLMLLLKQR